MQNTPKHTCVYCGKTDCFECNYWLDQRNTPGGLVTKEYVHYRMGPEKSSIKGHGGQKFKITHLESMLVVYTTNLWHQGEIPVHLRNKFIPNATVEQENGH